MATTFNTPGVYVQEIPVFSPSVAVVPTAIPAFIGYTTIGLAVPANPPVVKRITSLMEYEQNFGAAHKETSFSITVNDTVVGGNLQTRAISVALTPSGYNLYYNIQMYFANGGGPCYIVSVGNATTPDTIAVADFVAGLDAIAKEDEPTLLLFPDAVNLDDANYGTVFQAALTQCAKLQDRFVIGDLRGNSIATADVTAFRTALGANNLKYGAIYTPFLETGLGYSYDDAAVVVAYRINNVLQTGNDLGDYGPAGANINLLLYNQIVQAIISQKPVILPPSPSMAGIYAAVDNDRGVWKAPANVSLTLVNAPTIAITEAQQGGLNIDPASGKSINAIRTFTGRGIIVWGARTLDGNSNEWRYIPVRRLFINVEESVKKATEPVVFEANDKNTWLRVKGTISNFLTDLWRQGALAGDKPEQAFFVKIGLNETMTAQDILEGKMIVVIGMAAVRPAEFIVLQFMHKLQES